MAPLTPAAGVAHMLLLRPAHYDMVADEGLGLSEVPGIGMHLSAAHLRLGEDDLMAEPLQDGDCGLRCLGEHRVRQTCGE